MSLIAGAAPPSERLYIRRAAGGSALEVSADGVTWTPLDYLTLPSGGEAGQILKLGAGGALEWGDAAAGAGTGAVTLTLVRPVSDLALFPVVQASASADFASVTTLDAHSVAADRAYCKVFTGDEWIDIPTSGLGSAFDGLTVSVDMSTKFAGLTQPYYVRYCWRTAAGADSDYVSLRFPSVGTPGGGQMVANPVGGNVAGLKIAKLTATEYAALEPDADTLYLIVEDET